MAKLPEPFYAAQHPPQRVPIADVAKGLFGAPAPAAPARMPLPGPVLLPTPPELDAEQTLALPPGNMGELVSWLYASAMYPVREVALVTALGLMAGIAGRAYTAPSPRLTGLNVYLVLIARSASGKEALHELAGMLMTTLRAAVPGVGAMVNFADYASGPALAKACAGEPRSMVNFSSEFGRKLKRMANPKDAPMADLRTVLTKLWSKSGPQSVAGDLVYSDAKASVSVPGAVSFSLVGESTPGTVLAALTDDMAEDGLLSRIQFVEVCGERPAYNAWLEGGLPPLPPPVLEALQGVAQQALTLLGRNASQPVGTTDAARQALDAFRTKCDASVRAAGADELMRAMWNRAHLKALKYCGLMAALEEPLNPMTTVEQAQWAIYFSERGVRVLQRKQADGDLGDGDQARQRKLVLMLRQYILHPVPERYRIPEAMRVDGVVPRRYLQQRTSDVAAFSQHRLGATAALDMALKSLCDSGYLVELDKLKATESYTFQGRCFRVVQLPAD